MHYITSISCFLSPTGFDHCSGGGFKYVSFFLPKIHWRNDPKKIDLYKRLYCFQDDLIEDSI